MQSRQSVLLAEQDGRPQTQRDIHRMSAQEHIAGTPIVDIPRRQVPPELEVKDSYGELVADMKHTKLPVHRNWRCTLLEVSRSVI